MNSTTIESIYADLVIDQGKRLYMSLGDGFYLSTAENMIAEQKFWYGDVKANDIDFSTSRYWLTGDAEMEPVGIDAPDDLLEIFPDFMKIHSIKAMTINAIESGMTAGEFYKELSLLGEFPCVSRRCPHKSFAYDFYLQYDGNLHYNKNFPHLKVCELKPYIELTVYPERMGYLKSKEEYLESAAESLTFKFEISSNNLPNQKNQIHDLKSFLSRTKEDIFNEFFSVIHIHDATHENVVHFVLDFFFHGWRQNQNNDNQDQ